MTDQPPPMTPSAASRRIAIHHRAETICRIEIGYQNRNTMIVPLERATEEAIETAYRDGWLAGRDAERQRCAAIDGIDLPAVRREERQRIIATLRQWNRLAVSADRRMAFTDFADYLERQP